ncbi:MAG: DUF2461 family protein [Ilumatobacter sp.]|uniref:DUF2461 family protein n=1 Tax=Ilumatobacter sp. TaxID=1967498 RepID=UPI00260BD17F|nr:DUF2461 family protein [Ilumatobacter sp.]MDJ0768096.1 DUF2461 family protein [Ilumatobacter sp.]
MTFTGFDPDAVALLDQLSTWDAETYGAHKAQLGAGLTKPAAALIAQVADRLDAELTVAARGSVSPLHNDLRFAGPGAPRYKDYAMMTTWEGDDKKTSPILWIRIDAHRAGFASGIGFTPEVRDRWREAVGGDAGEALAEAIGALVDRRGAEVAGDQVKKVPSPWNADHPRADLLRRTGFQIRFVDDLPDSVGAPEFADWCVDHLDALLPVHRWLVANVTRG